MRAIAALLPAWSAFCLGLVLPSICWSVGLDQPVDFCDPGLRVGAGADGYQMRGDRCEGLYARPLSAVGGLRIVSLARVSSTAELKPGQTLRLAWTTPNDREPIHLRGYSLRREIYYRMDSVRPGGSATYSWPTEVLRSVGLSLRDLGIICWIQEKVGDEVRRVYLPLRVGDEMPSDDNFQATIISDERLGEAYLTLAKVGPEGRPDLYLENETPLKRGYYPASVGIGIPIPRLPQRGFYVMELGATFGDGGSLATSAFLYNPEPSSKR